MNPNPSRDVILLRIMVADCMFVKNVVIFRVFCQGKKIAELRLHIADRRIKI